MTIPKPDAIIATISQRCGHPESHIADVLAGHGISLVPTAPAKRSLDIHRLTLRGTRTGTGFDGAFDSEFNFGPGVTALITDENLRGKSTVLELITWALRGSPRKLRADVKPWFDRVTLEYAVNGQQAAVVLNRTDVGHIADIIRADSRGALREFLDDGILTDQVHILAASMPENEFARYQGELMASLLSFDPISSFQKYSGSDEGRAVVHTWPTYFGGIYLPEAGSEILFGDTVFAGLPARILQMFCNIPLMTTQIRLTTLTKQLSQDDRNRARRADGDAKSRGDERQMLVDHLEQVERQLANLPSTSARPTDVIAGELRAAENEARQASRDLRLALAALDEAKAMRQADELRANNAREHALAQALFHGLTPSHCPRCEQGIEPQRTQLESADHVCSVCTRDIPITPAYTDTDDGEREDHPDALDALLAAEAAAQASVDDLAVAETDLRSRVGALVDELTEASQSQEFTTMLELRLQTARLAGRIESLPDVATPAESSESTEILDAARKVLNDITGEAAIKVFGELNEELVALGQKFGIDNLDAVVLNRTGGMKVTTAGVEAPFKDLSGGERLRIRVAVVVALLRVGHRSGMGSHPGLVLLDSPGSDELTVNDEATLVEELHALLAELPDLQVVIASAEPSAVEGHLPDECIYSRLDGGPLW